MVYHHLIWQVTYSTVCLQLSDSDPVYYITELLLFRPFLLFCLELKRRGVNDILRERDGGVEMVELHQAAGHSVRAAKDIVDFCDNLFSLNIGIQVRLMTTVEYADPLIWPSRGFLRF
jgi:hypothetical protein